LHPIVSHLLANHHCNIFALLENASEQPCILQKLSRQQNPNGGKRNLIWERGSTLTRGSFSMDSQRVNSGQRLVKVGQIRGTELEILIFLDVSANLDYQISKGLIWKINTNINW